MARAFVGYSGVIMTCREGVPALGKGEVVSSILSSSILKSLAFSTPSAKRPSEFPGPVGTVYSSRQRRNGIAQIVRRMLCIGAPIDPWIFMSKHPRHLLNGYAALNHPSCCGVP